MTHLSSPNPDESGSALRSILSLSNQNTADDREKTEVYFLIHIMLPIKIDFTAWQILLDSHRTMGIAKC